MTVVAALISIFLAAFFKACADTIKHHPDTSIFKNRSFWIGEGKIIPYTKYKVDGWHFCSSLMIASFLILIFIEINYNLFYIYFLLGVIFILVFNTFYNKILRK